MFLLKDTSQWRQWGSNPRHLCLKSSTLPLSHYAPIAACDTGWWKVERGGQRGPRFFVCLICCFTSQVNSYGPGGPVSSPFHTFSWTSLNKQLTSNSGPRWCGRNWWRATAISGSSRQSTPKKRKPWDHTCAASHLPPVDPTDVDDASVHACWSKTWSWSCNVFLRTAIWKP